MLTSNNLINVFGLLVVGLLIWAVIPSKFRSLLGKVRWLLKNTTPAAVSGPDYDGLRWMHRDASLLCRFGTNGRPASITISGRRRIFTYSVGEDECWEELPNYNRKELSGRQCSAMADLFEHVCEKVAKMPKKKKTAA